MPQSNILRWLDRECKIKFRALLVAEFFDTDGALTAGLSTIGVGVRRKGRRCFAHVAEVMSPQ